MVKRRGQSREPSNGFAAHLLVRIGARDVGEHVGVIEARHRRAAHARVGVLARERPERVGLLRSDLIDRCRTYGRIRAAVQGPDGSLYLTTDNGSDRIIRVTPSQ